jgi:hypothetical protein
LPNGETAPDCGERAKRELNFSRSFSAVWQSFAAKLRNSAHTLETQLVRLTYDSHAAQRGENRRKNSFLN